MVKLGTSVLLYWHVNAFKMKGVIEKARIINKLSGASYTNLVVNVNYAQREESTDKGNPRWTCLFPTVILSSFRTALMAYCISLQENMVAEYRWRTNQSGCTFYSATDRKVENDFYKCYLAAFSREKIPYLLVLHKVALLWDVRIGKVKLL